MIIREAEVADHAPFLVASSQMLGMQPDFLLHFDASRINIFKNALQESDRSRKRFAYMIPQTTRPAPKPPKNVPAMMLSKRLQKKQKVHAGQKILPVRQRLVVVRGSCTGRGCLYGRHYWLSCGCGVVGGCSCKVIRSERRRGHGHTARTDGASGACRAGGSARGK